MHSRSRSSGARRQRGATVVEYALGISAIVLAMLGGVKLLESTARTELTNKGAAIGMPDLDEAAPTLPSTTATTAPQSVTTTSGRRACAVPGLRSPRSCQRATKPT